MKILLTAHRFWPHVGGTEIAVERLAQRFAQRGHDVTVATSAEPGSPAEQERAGFRIRRFEMRRVGKFRFPPAEYFRFVQGPEWDIVHLHGQRVWSSDHLYPRLRKVHAPIVFTAHGFYQMHVERTPVLDPLYYRVVLPRALRRAARVTALTTRERQELVAMGVAESKLDVVPDGFDPEEFEALPRGFRTRYGLGDGPLLLYVGGFYPNKRVDRLVEAAALARAQLVAIGKDTGGPAGRAECEALALRLGVKASFLGVVPRADVLSAYAESDLFLLGSDFEGYGLVLLEAMAAGLPFVSTGAGAAPDLAAHGAGIIAEDAAGIAAAARSLLDDPARRAAMAVAARRAAPEHSWDAVAARYLEIYEEVARA